MAAQPGSLVVFSLDQSGGALVDISAYLKNAPIDRSRDTADVSTYGSTWKSFLALLMSGSISLEGEFQTAADNVLNAAFESGVTLTYQCDPLGVGSGKPRLTGECWCSSYKINPPVESDQTFSATLQMTGVCTRSLQA